MQFYYNSGINDTFSAGAGERPDPVIPLNLVSLCSRLPRQREQMLVTLYLELLSDTLDVPEGTRDGDEPPRRSGLDLSQWRPLVLGVWPPAPSLPPPPLPLPPLSHGLSFLGCTSHKDIAVNKAEKSLP